MDSLHFSQFSQPSFQPPPSHRLPITKFSLPRLAGRQDQGGEDVTDASSNLTIVFEAASSATFSQAYFQGDMSMRVMRGLTVLV